MSKEKLVVLERCSGECCKAFTICGYNKEDIHNERIAIEKSIFNTEEEKGDLIFIDDMIIEIGLFKSHPYHPSDYPILENEVMYFTCKHFDKENNLCINYENRPKMCSDYPHYKKEGKCEYKNCTYKFIFENIEKDFLLKGEEKSNVKKEI